MEHLLLLQYFYWVLVLLANGENQNQWVFWRGRGDNDEGLEVTGKQDEYCEFDMGKQKTK